MKLVLATQNKNKLKEIQELLPIHWNVVTLDQLGIYDELSETGETLEFNALEKANYVFEKTGLATLADDSGLEVEYLFGAPGVHSARYASDLKNDSANRVKLLQELKSTNNRRGQFRTILAYRDNRVSKLFEGVVQGMISTEEIGDNGFGYDSIFRPLECNDLTFAQMDLSIKQKISHRSKAIKHWLHWVLNEK
tara:strand:- start:2523 stop:3104 length:582 start_codon:yes stop_codon:yes gene_type:complete